MQHGIYSVKFVPQKIYKVRKSARNLNTLHCLTMVGTQSTSVAPASRRSDRLKRRHVSISTVDSNEDANSNTDNSSSEPEHPPPSRPKQKRQKKAPISESEDEPILPRTTKHGTTSKAPAKKAPATKAPTKKAPAKKAPAKKASAKKASAKKKAIVEEVDVNDERHGESVEEVDNGGEDAEAARDREEEGKDQEGEDHEGDDNAGENLDDDEVSFYLPSERVKMTYML